MRSLTLIKAALSAVTILLFCSSCELGRPRPLVTVYAAEMKVSVPVPQGWSSEIGEQAGFQMRIFTGPSVDVPERPGIRVQVMQGPMPEGSSLDELSRRYTEGHYVSHEQGYSLHGQAGKSWFFVSHDRAESSRLMLTQLDDVLYGLYAHGETATMKAHRSNLDAMWEGLSIEKERFFESYHRADFGLRFKYPRSWRETGFVVDPAKSLFVSFRSPPLAVEGTTTIHATLEVNVNRAPPGATLESFYASRVEIQGDNYRLLRHEPLPDRRGISDLYHIETQLADYLERTVYFVRGPRSYVFKFNVWNRVFRQIEPWIDDVVRTFAPYETGPIPEPPSGYAR
ncbi:MAG: hypothetical protein ACE5JI_21170 [Acidobacteriota bacterium]